MARTGCLHPLSVRGQQGRPRSSPATGRAATRHIPQPNLALTRRTQVLLRETEKLLDEWKHPDPYRPPTAPGGMSLMPTVSRAHHLHLTTGNKWERNLPARILPCTLTIKSTESFHQCHTNLAQMRKLPAPTRRFSGHQTHVYVIWPIANEVPFILIDLAKSVDWCLRI